MREINPDIESTSMRDPSRYGMVMSPSRIVRDVSRLPVTNPRWRSSGYRSASARRVSMPVS
ncbi:MAG: hypothetical protein HFJ91_03100 [Muribaculaceae bacterium]|nr:hypothetical protein [Muribaculaceae bacterium]